MRSSAESLIVANVGFTMAGASDRGSVQPQHRYREQW
jgi:hypothetical protein